jgi:hypothetical protein
MAVPTNANRRLGESFPSTYSLGKKLQLTVTVTPQEGSVMFLEEVKNVDFAEYECKSDVDINSKSTKTHFSHSTRNFYVIVCFNRQSVTVPSVRIRLILTVEFR